MSDVDATGEPPVNEPNNIPPQDDQSSVNDDPPANSFVSREDHDRALRDMKKFKEGYQKLKDELSQKELQALKSKEEWKKVAELKEQEAAEAQEKYQNLQGAFVNDRKASAIRAAALEAGVRKEALDDLELFPFDDVVVEHTSTGRVNVLNAKEAIDRLKLTKPYLFGSKRVNVNPSGPDVVSGGKITYEQVKKADEEARKTGDYAPYYEVLRKFQSQS